MKRMYCLLLSVLMILCIAVCVPDAALAASTLTIYSPGDWELFSWDDSLTVKWDTVTGASGYYVSIRNLSTDELLLSNKYTTSKSMKVSSYFPEESCRLKIWVGAVTSSSQAGSEAFTSDEIQIYISHEPGITNGASSSVTETSAVLKMSVDYDYGYAITDCGFYIGTSSSISSMEQYSFYDYSPSYGATTKGTKYMTVTGLNPGTTYYYRAYAENEVGEDYTTAKSFTTEASALEDPVITYPIDSNTYTGNQSIKLQWDDVDGVDGYRYYIKQLSGTPDRTNENEAYVDKWEGSVSSSRTYYTLSSSNVVGGYWYKFVVESYADGMDSGWSDWCYVYVEKGTLADAVVTYPDNNSTIQGYQDIPLIWNKVSGAEGYHYYLKRLSGTPSYVDENEPFLQKWDKSVSADTTSFKLTADEALPGYWYKFVVEAYAEGMNTSWSEWVYFYLDEIDLQDPVLSSPANRSTVSHGESIALKWNSVSNADGYRYHIKQLSGEPQPDNENESYVSLWSDTLSAGTTSYTFSGADVVGGYWYKFVIEAYSAYAGSAWSDWCYVYAAPGTLEEAVIVHPANTASYSGHQDMKLDWNSVSGADGYIYHIKRLSGIPDRTNENEPCLEEWVDYAPAGATAYTLPASKFIPGYWYKFVVETYADGMTTSWSDWVYCYADEVELEDPVISLPATWSESSAGSNILVDWNAVDGADGYRCHIKQLVGEPDTSNDNELAVNGWEIDCGTTSKYTLSAGKVVGGYWYKFVVEAYSDQALSSWSDWVYVYVPSTGTLDRPVITSPKASVDYKAGESVMFTWAKVENATNYTFYVKQLAGEPDYSSNEKAVNSWSGTTGASNRYFTLEGDDVQENTWYKFVVEAEADGYDSSWSKYTYIRIPEREDWIHFVLGSAMTQISDEAFAGNALLRTFDAGDTRLEAIGSRAFANCTNLKSINLPMSVYSIADNAFDNCPQLTIHCISGSAAEEYALRKGIPIEIHGIAVETDTVQLSQSQWSIGSSDSAETVIRVSSSGQWTARSDSAWLTLGTQSGKDGENVVFSAAKNTTQAVRTAVVTFTCGQATRQMTVTQHASSIKVCGLKLQPDYWEPSRDMLAREIVVAHDGGFTVSSNQSWLTYRVENATIYASVSSAALNTASVGVLTVTCSDCGAKKTVTVAIEQEIVPTPATVRTDSSEPHAIKIFWSEVSGASYIIERCSDGSSWKQIASVGAGVTSYTDADADYIGASTTHQYRVTACKVIGGTTVYSEPSDAVYGTSDPEHVLEFTGTIGTLGDNGRAPLSSLTSLSWTTVDKASYKITLKNVKTGSYIHQLKDVGSANSFPLTGLLAEGGQYAVWVGAYNDAGRLIGQSAARSFIVSRENAGNESVSYPSNKVDFSDEIWDILTVNWGLTSYQAAGMMASLKAESEFCPYNAQNFPKWKGVDDRETYVFMVDDVAGQQYTEQVGFGLAQWTAKSRKQALLDFAVAKGDEDLVWDFNTQMEFLKTERSIVANLKATKTLYEATEWMDIKFEVPSQSHSSAWPGTRYDTAKAIYKKYTGTDYVEPALNFTVTHAGSDAVANGYTMDNNAAVGAYGTLVVNSNYYWRVTQTTSNGNWLELNREYGYNGTTNLRVTVKAVPPVGQTYSSTLNFEIYYNGRTKKNVTVKLTHTTASDTETGGSTNGYAPALPIPALTGTSQNRLIQVAKSQIGYIETDNNQSVYGAFTGTPGESWCAPFVSWCAAQAGLNDIFKVSGTYANPDNVLKTGYSVWYFDTYPSWTSKNAAPGKGFAYFMSNASSKTFDSSRSIVLPQKGDLIFFATSGGAPWAHVGIVESYDASAKIITYIDGNGTSEGDGIHDSILVDGKKGNVAVSEWKLSLLNSYICAIARPKY